MSDKSITTREKDYSQWYLDVIKVADLAEHSEVKGAMIIKPYGFAIWEAMQKVLGAAIKATGTENAYFPLLIPEHYLSKEKEHVEGFKPELAVVTHAGGQKLDEPLVIRPTSETIIYVSFAKWIQSWRDLPLKINQWANVVRWELRPRLFLRTTEFLWQEGHTAHATIEEADAFAREMLEVYRQFVEEWLAIPVIAGVKTDAEKFAGAHHTYTLESIMQDGKALQMGTSHNLGENFARVFEVKYLDKDKTQKYCSQTSWGVSTRLVGGLIMAHSDDKGLVLPPKIAPIQVIVIPIGKTADERAQTVAAAREVVAHLVGDGIRAKLDDRDYESPGSKFYEWEKKGVPVRIEIGPKDVARKQSLMVDRLFSNKITAPLDRAVAKVVRSALDDLQRELFVRASAFLEKHTHEFDDYMAFKKRIEDGGFFRMHWCGSAACEARVKGETKATIRCIPFDAKDERGACVVCGKPSDRRVVFARAY